MKREQDIKETLAQLHLDPQEARQIANDIRAGDELLDRHGPADIDPAVLERIEQTVRAQLPETCKKGHWGRRIVAAAAVVLLLIGITTWLTYNTASPTAQPGKEVALQQADPFESEINMWELSLQETDDAAEQIYELPLTEIAVWLDELETENTDDTLGKEHNHETLAKTNDDTIGTGTV